MKKILTMLLLNTVVLVTTATPRPIKNEYLGLDKVWHVILPNNLSPRMKQYIAIQKQRLDNGDIDIHDFENYKRMISSSSAEEILKIADQIKN